MATERPTPMTDALAVRVQGIVTRLQMIDVFSDLLLSHNNLERANAGLVEVLESVCALDVIYGSEFRNRPEVVAARSALAQAKATTGKGEG